MAHHRYFIHLAYKGTRYFGWQVQPGIPSVQAAIESVLTRLNSNQTVEITGCGRTDTGVHASSYYTHFDSPVALDELQLKYKLNLMLPDDIAVYAVREVDASAHARFDALSRTYEYLLHHDKNPFISETSWHFTPELNVTKINEACRIIASHQDFEAFSKVHTSVHHFRCDIHEIRWEATENGYRFTISANRFLRNMVRAIVGTLIDVGQEKITPAEVDAILRSRKRSNAGVSVPAKGLMLTAVKYPFDP